jgi:hypothetical protein
MGLRQRNRILQLQIAAEIQAKEKFFVELENIKLDIANRQTETTKDSQVSIDRLDNLDVCL